MLTWYSPQHTRGTHFRAGPRCCSVPKEGLQSHLSLCSSNCFCSLTQQNFCFWLFYYRGYVVPMWRGSQCSIKYLFLPSLPSSFAKTIIYKMMGWTQWDLVLCHFQDSVLRSEEFLPREKFLPCIPSANKSETSQKALVTRWLFYENSENGFNERRSSQIGRVSSLNLT